MKPDDFIAAIAPAAKASAEKTKIPASFTIAEAALESGWGSSQLAKQGKNLFGVKATQGWTGETLTMRTREFIHGEWVVVPALWRKYDDWLGCIEDHAAFLINNPRYKACFDCTDGKGFTRAVAAAGYASDPDYAKKVCSVIDSHNLAVLDA